MSQSLHLFTPSTLPKQCYSYSKPSFPTLNRGFPVTSVRFSPIRASSSDLDPSSSQVLLASDNGTGGGVLAPATRPPAQAVDSGSIEVDSVTETELKENGFRSTRRTKLVCTIGPATCGFEQLEALAVGGMNVARINMCHGTRAWHRAVIESVRRLNDEKGYAVAIMMDTEGSEIHMGDFGGASSGKAEDGEIWTFSVRAFDSALPERTINVNYDGFAEDVKVGDELLVDGGMVRFDVIEKIGPDVKCRCTDPGLLLPRANLTFWRDGSLVRERNAMLPTISSKDWLDIDFGIQEGVDFIAISFVKSAEVINHLKSYIAARARDSDISVIAKIESIDSLKNLEEIIQASDGAMVARGDLGAQIPLEQVPSAQQRIVQVCRQLNKPVIVASQLLESMIEYPTPTRAEVADVSEAVRQRADALMLSGESAMGQFPEKALTVLRSVSLRIERWWREEKRHEDMELPDIGSSFSDNISEEICSSAAKMANNLEVDALFVYTKTGHMASLLSRCRPDCPIFAFTTTTSVRRRLNLQWGLIPFRLSFSDDMEGDLNKTFALLKARYELYLNLVLEYVPETVYRVIRHYHKMHQRMPLTYVKIYFYQICRALAYIHNSVGVCHRDIKPQNLLVNPHTHQVKLCDFGSAKVLVNGETNISYICSRYYRAPELIFGATQYTTAIDMWSAGCVLAELLLGEPLFSGERAVDQLVEIIKVLGTPTREEIKRMNPNYTEFKFPQIKAYPWHKIFYKRVPPEAVDLVSRLLQYSPNLRSTALEVLVHPFFDELRDPNTCLPNGRPLPPLFNFKPHELKEVPAEMVVKLIPKHARKDCTFFGSS